MLILITFYQSRTKKSMLILRNWTPEKRSLASAAMLVTRARARAVHFIARASASAGRSPDGRSTSTLEQHKIKCSAPRNDRQYDDHHHIVECFSVSTLDSGYFFLLLEWI
jgi:hypothetical protein